MKFLEDLLTIDNTYLSGPELRTKNVSLRNFASIFYTMKPKKPVRYKTYRSKAGLPFIVPLNDDGSVFVYPGKNKNFKRKRIWDDSMIPASNNFFVNETAETRTNEGLIIFSSRMSKIVREEFGAGDFVFIVDYNITENFELNSLRFQYVVGKTAVSFDVYRFDGNTVVAEGPKVRTEEKNFIIPSSRGVNQEKTIGSLFKIAQKNEINLYDFISLVNFKYLTRRILH